MNQNRNDVTEKQDDLAFMKKVAYIVGKEGGEVELSTNIVSTPSPDRTLRTVMTNEHDDDDNDGDDDDEDEDPYYDFDVAYRYTSKSSNSEEEEGSYESDTNKSDNCCQWEKLLIIFILIMVLSAAVSLGLYFGRYLALSSTEDNNISLEDLQQRNFTYIASKLYNKENYPTDPNSSEYKAIDFIAQEKTLEPESLRQRFALANIYFAMNGDYWIDSLDFTRPNLHECNWNSLVDGQIKGVTCDRRQVATYLSISKNNLSGTIPVIISSLMENLGHFDLSSNNIEGKIPISFSTTELLSDKLQYFSLANNQLTGEFVLPKPSPSLVYFSIERNQLTGNINSLCSSSSGDRVLQSDCLGDVAEINCTCCTRCCNRNNTCSKGYN